MPVSLHDRLLEKYASLIDALADPERRRRAILWLALGYGAVWWLYALIAKSSQGINADMAEMLVWGRNPDWGYPKHPPLLGWIVGAWFSVFPAADWAFYLLSAVTLAAGIVLAFVLAGEWLDGRKRALVPFLLALIPFYNFLGLKFDQNSALIPLWALTVWAFVRSLDTRKTGYAALAGIAAAAAMLTKYWSAFLILALVLAALLDRRRVGYFRSAAPWITVAVGAVLIAPHVVWLVRNDFPPITWVSGRRVSQSLFEAVSSAGEYALATAAYCAFALAVYGIYVRPSPGGLRDSAFSGEGRRRRAAIIFWLPLAVPVAFALALKTNLLSLWNTPALSLLPVMLMASPLIEVTRDAAARIAATTVTFTLAVLAVSPAIAGILFSIGVENYASYARDVAVRVESEWRATSGKPLAILAGPFALTNSAAFYLKDGPATYSDFLHYLSPWITDERIARQGAVIVCPADNGYCGRNLDSLLARHRGGRFAEFSVTPRWLWLSGEPERFLVATLPPR
ncbi:MAG TPA: glycosyltransferase family 39 protein [Pseudorhodoplanes sp.]|jgi:4-amino-4-deoxy-L-arabinose transferase-like glycosyltransferase|nr:glycosyltransferase family 39 protein [Pseudorhodoplanes sp.]